MVLLLVTFPYEVKGAELKDTVSYENKVQQKESLLEKAIDAFPEYEKELRGENDINFAKVRSGGMGNVVINETRKLSDTEIVNYTQYDSGIATAAIGLQTGKNITSTINGTRYTEYKMDMWLICGTSSSILYVKDVVFCINLTDYDAIYSKGSVVNNIVYNSVAPVLQEYIDEETATRSAKLQYSAYFEFYVHINGGEQPYLVWGNIILEVGNNTYTLSSS